MRYLRALVLLIFLLAPAGCGQSIEERTEGTSAAADDTIVLAAYRPLAPGVHDSDYCSRILGV